MTNYPVVRHRWQAARLWGTCNYPLSLFACLFRQAHALRSFGQPIYIEVSELRVIQVPHGLSCLLNQELHGSISGEGKTQGCLFVRRKASPGDLFPARVRTAVVGVGMDGDTAARREFAPDLDILRVHERDEVLHDSVHAILVEIAVIAEREQIEFQALALHHALIRHVVDVDRGEIGLTRDRAEARELGAVELHEVVVFGMFVLEGLQHLRCVIGGIAYLLVSQQFQAFIFAGLRHGLPF